MNHSAIQNIKDGYDALDDVPFQLKRPGAQEAVQEKTVKKGKKDAQFLANVAEYEKELGAKVAGKAPPPRKRGPKMVLHV